MPETRMPDTAPRPGPASGGGAKHGGVPRLGLQLNTTQSRFRYAEIRELARSAEQAGFASVWTEDHLWYQDQHGDVIGPWEAWTLLAALAEATESLRLGTLVTPIAMRRPVMVAKEAVTVDEISGGRLILGLGAGWNEAEHQALEVPLEGRVARFEEALDIVLALFDHGHVEHHGTHYDLEASMAPRGTVRPRPELLVGSFGPRMLRKTLPHVNGWNWDGFTMDWPHLRGKMALVDEVCQDVGRDPGEVWRSAHLVCSLEGARGLPVNLPPDEPVLGGNLESLVEGLQSCAAEGLDEVMLIVDPPTPEAVEMLGTAARLAAT